MHEHVNIRSVCKQSRQANEKHYRYAIRCDAIYRVEWIEAAIHRSPTHTSRTACMSIAPYASIANARDQYKSMIIIPLSCSFLMCVIHSRACDRNTHRNTERHSQTLCCFVDASNAACGPPISYRIGHKSDVREH